MSSLAEAEPKRRVSKIPSVIKPGDIAIDNQTLAQFLEDKIGKELSPQKISQVTGIETRHRLQPLGQDPKPICETVPRLAMQAAEELVNNFQIDPSKLDYVFVCTSYPFGKSVSSEVKEYLETDCPAFDVYGACAGPGYLLYRLNQISEFKEPTNILIIAAEHYSANMAKNDLDGSIFSDGATAILLRLGVDFEIVDSTYNFYPSDDIQMPIDYSLVPHGSLVISSISNKTEYFKMIGHKVYRWFLEGVPIQNVVEMHNSRTLASRGKLHMVFHPGSGRIVKAIDKGLKEFGIRTPVCSRTVKDFGNLASGGSIAELGALLHDPGAQIEKGDEIIVATFGAGYAQANIALQALRKPS